MNHASDQETTSIIRGGHDRDGYVFISYKREEVAQAARIRTVLIDNGFDVWWDEDIQCGQIWNEVLDDAVKDAGCIVVLWSSRSMQSRWVMHEASAAMDREAYAPVRIELCSIPPPYDRIQATDVFEWDGHSHHPGIRDLLRLVSSLLPLRRSVPVRILDAFWANRATFLAVLFACLALGILIWQTGATHSQLRQTDQIISQQTAIIDEQKAGIRTLFDQFERDRQALDGASIVASVEFPEDSPFVRQHHEKMRDAYSRLIGQYQKQTVLATDGEHPDLRVVGDLKTRTVDNILLESGSKDFPEIDMVLDVAIYPKHANLDERNPPSPAAAADLHFAVYPVKTGRLRYFPAARVYVFDFADAKSLGEAIRDRALAVGALTSMVDLPGETVTLGVSAIGGQGGEVNLKELSLVSRLGKRISLSGGMLQKRVEKSEYSVVCWFQGKIPETAR